MTEASQQIAIAKFCGWVFHPEGNPPSLPDYLHDFNAIKNAESSLDCDSADRFLDVLHLIRNCFNADRCRCVHATAAQRAEALLKTIGKWKD